MDFNRNTQRPVEPGEAQPREKYWETKQRDDTPVGVPVKANLRVLDFYRSEFTSKKGNVIAKYTAVVERGDTHKYLELSFWGGMVTYDEKGNPVEGDPSPDCWDVLYLLDKQRPNCLAKEDYFAKLSRTIYPNAIGCLFTGVFMCSGVSKKGYPYYNGKMFEYKTELSVTELLAGKTEAQAILTAPTAIAEASEYAKNTKDVRARQPQTNAVYGGATPQPQQNNVYGGTPQPQPQAEPQGEQLVDDNIPF